MFAPQYPEGLRLDIYSYTLVGGNNGQDVKEINVLNHYIGMHDLVNESFTEFKWMPFVIGALGLLVLRAVVHGTVAALVDVTMLFVYFGAFSLWSFGYKLYRYGHDLDRRRRPCKCRRSCRRCSATSRSRTSRSIPIRGRDLRDGGRDRAAVGGVDPGRGGRPAAPDGAADRGMTVIGPLLIGPAAGRPRSSRSPARRASARRSTSPSRRWSIARTGDRDVPAGTYDGDLLIDRPLTLRGIGRPTLRGSGTGSVFACAPPASPSRASTSTAAAQGDLGRDTSGIHVVGAARHHPRLPHPPVAVRHLPARSRRCGGREQHRDRHSRP